MRCAFHRGSAEFTFAAKAELDTVKLTLLAIRSALAKLVSRPAAIEATKFATQYLETQHNLTVAASAKPCGWRAPSREIESQLSSSFPRALDWLPFAIFVSEMALDLNTFDFATLARMENV